MDTRRILPSARFFAWYSAKTGSLVTSGNQQFTLLSVLETLFGADEVEVEIEFCAYANKEGVQQENLRKGGIAWACSRQYRLFRDGG